MKAVAVNGSHRPGRSTSELLQRVLDGLATRGWSVQLVELANLDIAYCIGCNSCLKGRACPLQDDCANVIAAIREADAIILGSPNYFENVTARMKCFMDRLRPPHLAGNVLGGKVSGVVCTTGLSDAGADCALAVLRRFCDAQGWVMSGSTAVLGSWQEGCDDEGLALYRKNAAYDPRARARARARASADGLARELDILGRRLAR